MPFGSIVNGSPNPADVDLALVYDDGRRESALLIRERLRSAVGRLIDLPCDFMILSRSEVAQERHRPQLRDDVFARLVTAEEVA